MEARGSSIQTEQGNPSASASLDAEARRHLDDPRYVRLLDATRKATRDGYNAVSMRRLAETCRISMTTIYSFCDSKDHLIVLAHLEGMEQLRDHLGSRPLAGATAEERVGQIVERFLRVLDDGDELARTLMRAVYSIEPGVDRARHDVGAAYAQMIDEAIGDEDLPDREAVIETLGAVVSNGVYTWMSKSNTTEEISASVARAVRVLFRPREPAGKPVIQL